MQDLFAEGLIKVQIHQGNARMDFARLESVDPENKKATFAPAVRLVMPLEAFMQAVEEMNRMREDILKKSKVQSANQPAT